MSYKCKSSGFNINKIKEQKFPIGQKVLGQLRLVTRKPYIIENICFILLSKSQNTLLKYCTICGEYSVISNLDLDNIRRIFIENNKMTQKLQHEYQRAQCVALSNAGLSCREASKFTGISKSSVQRAIKRFEENR